MFPELEVRTLYRKAWKTLQPKIKKTNRSVNCGPLCYLMLYPGIGVHGPYKNIVRKRKYMSAGNIRTKAVL